MEINILVKQLGKKHPVVAKQPLEIGDISSPATLKDVIGAVVRNQVAAFNEKRSNPELLKYLSSSEIENSTKTGKVDFGTSYNDEQADPDKAVDNALLAFEDGMYCVFVDDNQVEKLDEAINLTTESTFAFVRLTFLAGSYW